MATALPLDVIANLSAVPAPGKPHGVPIPGTATDKRSPIYRHYRFRDGPLVSTFDPNVQTLYDYFQDAVRRFGNAKALGTRPWNPQTKTWDNKYTWLTYNEVSARSKNVGAGLVEIHNRAGITDDKYGVGLWSQNRAEWHISDFGITSQSLFSVSLYETLGPDTTEYIINHASLPCVMCSLPHIPALLKLAPRLPTLKVIVSLDPVDAGEPTGHTKLEVLNAMAAPHGIKVYSLNEVEAIGAQSGRKPRPPRKEDVATINYTSGTTGMPKGVVLSHENALSGIMGGRASGSVSKGDVHISYLPLAHIFGRMVDMVALCEGARVGYFHGDISGLVDDMKILGPTGLMSVPRLYNKFNSALRAATVEAEGVKGAIARHIIETKKANMKKPAGQASNTHFLYDRIWTPKVKAAVGLQRTHSMVSGSAQLDPNVHEFLRAAFGNNFLQGYGLTESYAVASCQLRGDMDIGNVGPPAPCVEVCLESVPDMEYLVTDKPCPRGELLLRGPCIFREYYKNEEETKKAIDADGWFHTGDVAEIDSLGRIKIVDRKKNVLKLSQGEYISPERIENVYLGSTSIAATAYVHGDPNQSNLVGLFGIDPAMFAPFASKILKKPIDAADVAGLEAAGRDTAVRKAFLKVLDDVGRTHKFNSFEKVRNCALLIDPFTVENEMLTPTLKLKRAPIAKKYRDEITQLYAELEADPSLTAKAKL